MELELEDFVSAILEQITSAVKNNPDVLRKPDKDSPIPGIGYVYDSVKGHGWATKVEFDIAITKYNEKDGTAKLGIASIGVGGKASESQQTVSRVKYSVPLQFFSSQ